MFDDDDVFMILLIFFAFCLYAIAIVFGNIKNNKLEIINKVSDNDNIVIYNDCVYSKNKFYCSVDSLEVNYEKK